MVGRFMYLKKSIKVAILVNSLLFSNFFYCREITAGNNKNKHSKTSDVVDYAYEEGGNHKKNKKKIRDTLNLDKKNESTIHEVSVGRKDDQKPLILYNNNGAQPNPYVQPAIYQPQPIIITQPSNNRPSNDTQVQPIIITQPSNNRPSNDTQVQPIIITQPSNNTPVQPIVITQPTQNDRENSNERIIIKEHKGEKQIKPKKKKKNKDDRGVNNTYIINDSPIDTPFSGGSNFFRLRPKSFKAVTFKFLNPRIFELILNIRKGYNKYKQGPSLNSSGQHTFFGYCRWLITGLNMDTMDKIVVPVSLLLRIITDFNIELKHLVNEHFSVSFLADHILWPSLLLSVHSNFYSSSSVGISFKFGLYEVIGFALTLKAGNFYLKLNGPGISLLDFVELFYNNGLKKDNPNKAQSSLWNSYKRINEKWIYRFISWDVTDPAAEKIRLKGNLLYSMISNVSLELGGISERDAF